VGIVSGWLQYARGLILFVTGLLLAACVSLPQMPRSVHVSEQGTLGQCADFFAALDQQTRAAGVRDAGSTRVAGYPYLRVNRFLASFRAEAKGEPVFSDWLYRMQWLDQRARSREISNLPGGKVLLGKLYLSREDIEHRIQSCGDMLRVADFRTSEKKNALRKRVAVPDEYLSARRVLGLYPLSRYFVTRGITAWHKQARVQYSVHRPTDWNALTYDYKASRPTPAIVRKIVTRVPRDTLGIPRYSEAAQSALFRLYAPLLLIQTAAEFDRPGTPIWKVNGLPGIDNTHPVVYTRLSFTRFQGQILTQLNYVIWFASRPKESDWDIYGGVLDGLTFRVTLDNQGVPLSYETMHNCGCYYRVYPGKSLRLRAAFSAPEPPLILTSPEVDWQTQTLTIALDSRTHYVQHLFSSSRVETDSASPYVLADYSRLLSLPEGNRRRSLFSEDGTVSASARLERFLLWPTGVYSAGAMRQFGRHAIAFVGRRHFDDPYLLQQLFTRID